MTRPKNLSEAMRRGIFFIAHNDEPGDLDSKSISGYVSTIALAEAFGYSAQYIAIQIKRLRKASNEVEKL